MYRKHEKNACCHTEIMNKIIYLLGGDKNKMMNLNTKMTAQELEQMIAQMERIFTAVRI